MPEDHRLRGGKGRVMRDLLFVVGFIVVWLALQLWILPKLGVST